MGAVRKSFSPEFLNRMDEFVVFDALTKSGEWGVIITRVMVVSFLSPFCILHI